MAGLAMAPTGQGFGALVEGLDIPRATGSELDQCRQWLFEHGALFIRGQELDPQAQIDFAEALGTIVVNRFFTPVPGFPKVAQLLTEPTQDWIIGENWHTDHSYDVVPALGSILYAVEVPPVGGDTQFIGMQPAYDSLPPDLKERIEGLMARHESAHIFAPSEAIRLEEAAERNDGNYMERAATYPEAVHPVVLSHPETGRKGLYVNPEFTTGIVDMDKEEGDALLQQLYDHILQPQFRYVWKWQPGSLALWDNRSTWHKAMNDHRGHRRLMRRITLEGVPLDQGARAAA
ncbi:MAG: TauD/TfdA family dioxygenase [Sphingomonadaceae bacterium]